MTSTVWAPAAPMISVGASAAADAAPAASAGSRTVKVEPLPGALTQAISPCSISQNVLVIASPSPVPP